MRAGVFTNLRLALMVLVAGLWSQGAVAQELGLVRGPILILETDRLYKDSAFGQRVAEEIEAESAILAAENQRIMAELTAEESTLTEQRAGMEPAAFRELANAFDERAQTIRREQRQKLLSLQKKQEASRALFFAFAQPVLETLMREAGASVILERGTVALFTPSSDVTDLAILRVDATVGRGPEKLPVPDGP